VPSHNTGTINIYAGSTFNLSNNPFVQGAGKTVVECYYVVRTLPAAV
jgi:hypothetical protein